MTKKKIVENLTSNLNISNKKSLQFANAFINLIKKNSWKYKIKIHDFGVFYVHKTPKRIGRNPKTKESYIIQPRSKICFKASNKTKSILN